MTAAAERAVGINASRIYAKSVDALIAHDGKMGKYVFAFSHGVLLLRL